MSMVRRTDMKYVEFYEYINRYIDKVHKKEVESIPYDVYKPLMKFIAEKSVIDYQNDMVYIDLDFETNISDCLIVHQKGCKNFSLGPAEGEFANTIIDWREYGYPYQIEFSPCKEFKIAYQAVRDNFIHDLDIYETEGKKEDKQEEKTMKANFNFDFGVLKAGYVRMSPYGIAVESNGTWKAFDRNTGNIVDVGDFTFKMDGAFFKMPVAVDAVQKGDMLMFKNEPVYVMGREGEGFKVVAIADNEQKVIMPVTNIFGFNYMTKIVSMFDNMGFGNMMAPSADQPFGNMMPLMMMQMFSEGDSFNMGGDMGKMMMMSMMMGGQNPMANMFGQFAATLAPAQMKSNAVSDQS